MNNLKRNMHNLGTKSDVNFEEVNYRNYHWSKYTGRLSLRKFYQDFKKSNARVARLIRVSLIETMMFEKFLVFFLKKILKFFCRLSNIFKTFCKIYLRWLQNWNFRAPNAIKKFKNIDQYEAIVNVSFYCPKQSDRSE